MPEETKYIYTLSSRKDMVRDAILSIKSLTYWVDSEDIIVFFTPPRKQSDIEAIESLGVDLRLEHNDTEKFRFLNRLPGRYGEKIKVCSVDADAVVFLDCDTLILSDITDVIAGDFDIKARPGGAMPEEAGGQGLFEQFDAEYQDWVPNTGFLIFKNGAQKTIRSKWERVLSEMNQEHGYLEQFALAVAMSEYNVEKMRANEHSLEWITGVPPDGCVYHLETVEKHVPRTVKGNLYRSVEHLYYAFQSLIS